MVEMRYLTPILLILVAIIFGGLLHPASASAAKLSFVPTSQTVIVGSNLTATIQLDTQNEQINRVYTKITYPANLVTPQSIDTGNSFVNLWYQNNIGTKAGELILDGGVSGAGTTGSQLTFAKINFTANTAGSVEIRFSQDSAVHRESDGINVLTEAQTSTYTVTGSSPSPAPATPTPTGSTPPATTLTPTPSTDLPKSGDVAPTVLFLLFSVTATLIGFVILKKT